jgi:indole-3-glycerol phosphate synthase
VGDRLAPEACRLVGRGYDAPAVRGSRRFSQAVSEGDGISLLAEVSGLADAAAAAADGAEAIVVRSAVPDGLRAATELPILACVDDLPVAAASAGADAYLLVVDGLEDDDGRLERRYEEAFAAGLDPVVDVRDEDELQLALDRVDPEVFLLSARGVDGDALEHVLALLPDVPAGKLAVAEVEVRNREELEELERAGVDGVVVHAARVAELLGETTREPD